MKKGKETERELNRYACAVCMCVIHLLVAEPCKKLIFNIRSPFCTWTEHTLVLQIIITDGLLFHLLSCSVLLCSVRHAQHSRSRSPAFYFVRYVCECGCFVAYSMKWMGQHLKLNTYFAYTHKHRKHNCFKIESRGKYCMGSSTSHCRCKNWMLFAIHSHDGSMSSGELLVNLWCEMTYLFSS